MSIETGDIEMILFDKGYEQEDEDMLLFTFRDITVEFCESRIHIDVDGTTILDCSDIALEDIHKIAQGIRGHGDR